MLVNKTTKIRKVRTKTRRNVVAYVFLRRAQISVHGKTPNNYQYDTCFVCCLSGTCCCSRAHEVPESVCYIFFSLHARPCFKLVS